MDYFVSWDYVLWSFFILFAVAYAMDLAMRKKDVAKLRENLGELVSQEKFTYSSTIMFINVVFCNLFDVIYGRKSWSVRRLVLSACLSIAFIGFMVLLLGFSNTMFSKQNIELEAMILFVITNLIADYVSLLETRWVLEKARGKTLLMLAIWICIDVIFTTIIYLIVLYFTVFGYVLIQGSDPVAVLLEALTLPYTKSNEFVEMLTTRDMALPYFVSTYATSIVWFFFAASAFILRVVSGSAKVFRISINVMIASDAPARIVACIVICVVLIATLIAEIVYQVI